MAFVVIEREPPDIPPGLVTRRATEADLGRAVEVLALGAVPGTASAEDPSDLTPYRAALRGLQDASGAVLVAEVGGEVVGICQLIVFRHLQARGGLCAEIESVHVHPDHRGRGIGSVLVRDAVAARPGDGLLPRPADLEPGEARGAPLLRAPRVRTLARRLQAAVALRQGACVDRT